MAGVRAQPTRLAFSTPLYNGGRHYRSQRVLAATEPPRPRFQQPQTRNRPATGDFSSRPRGPPNRNGGGRQTGKPNGRQFGRKENKTICPINEDIRCPEVRVIGTDREPLGVMSTFRAQDMAQEADVDLVLITPDADPPVVRLVEYSKYKYELEKNKKTQQKKQRESKVDIKELKMRPNTDVHDYQVRLRSARKFLEKGNKVKLTISFRGREMSFKDESRKTFEGFMQDLGELAVPEGGPQMQGRNMSMIIAPKKSV